MHIDDVKRMQAEKDHLMRHEITHPVNKSEMHRYKHNLDGDMHGVDYPSHGAELQ
jgi:hypothetical protein